MGRSSGYTYIGLLVIVAVLGVSLAATGSLWHVEMTRERERELLLIGVEFQQALKSYRDASPGAMRSPRSLDELVEDKRLPVTRRHLRKIYVDPLTGRAEWGYLRLPDGGIIGVYSVAAGSPLKRARMPVALAYLEGTTRYRDWIFRAD